MKENLKRDLKILLVLYIITAACFFVANKLNIMSDIIGASILLGLSVSVSIYTTKIIIDLLRIKK